jgi:IS30 family transposase
MYTYERAIEIVRFRKKITAQTKYKKLTPEIESLILSLIKNYLSPEQVSGYLKRHHSIALSHETIYRFVYSDKARHESLKPYLGQGRKARRKRYGSGARASNIPNRVSIEKRSAIVEAKHRIGDFECETVIGKDRQSVLVTVVDRASLKTFCSRVFSRTASTGANAIIRMLKPYVDRVHTLTFDNGSEFVEHEKIGKALKAKTYFAAPYASWERGINENTNGLLRQFFPKGTNFAKVSWQAVKKAVDNLNNRPRKSREYLTPNEIFDGVLIRLI